MVADVRATPVARFGVAKRVEQFDDVAREQFARGPLTYCVVVEPRLGEPLPVTFDAKVAPVPCRVQELVSTPPAFSRSGCRKRAFISSGSYLF